MARKALHLQRRDNTYYLRVRVPDAPREVIGKGEIIKSLGTGDLKEVQQQARLEWVKLDGEWGDLLRRLSPAKVDRLSEAEIWYLVSSWLVEAEKSAADQRDSWASLDDASMDLSDLSEDHNLWSAAHAETDKLLAREGINLASSFDSRRLLEARMEDAILESTKRSVRRQFPAVPLHLDQQFAYLTAATKVKPVANFTLASLMKDVADDPTRPVVRGKTVVKREAQWRVIKEFFGPDAALEDISRSSIKEFMRLLERLPSNATKHFPDATF